MVVLHLYLKGGVPEGWIDSKYKELRALSTSFVNLNVEICFNVQVHRELSVNEHSKLKWLLACPFSPDSLSETTFLDKPSNDKTLIEIGPRLNFSTAFSTNAVSICQAIGLKSVTRLEKSFRYLIHYKEDFRREAKLYDRVLRILHDEMTECEYVSPITSFDHGMTPETWFVVDVLNKGKQALREVNDKLGLAFDSWDIDFYYDLFVNKLKRNPTSVECFDLAQSNSEHSRHWFFKGHMIINGSSQEESLLDMIIETQRNSNPNNVIKFSDNSSAIKGFNVRKILPKTVDMPSSFVSCQSSSHLIFTAETHNFPTGVAPFSGATTGTGGRIRDVQAVGRGGHCIAGTAGYSVGNLLMPGYEQPWENKEFIYPENLAKPLTILIEASNGASDYGNKFGEPLICGFTRSFGLKDNYGERREYIKPIMFSGGVGSMEADLVNKEYPEKGMLLTKVGGPVYRIGVGGGSASSLQVQGDNKANLDFGAVQRGDAEMENKMNRVIRACVEDGYKNPICSIHDQGAGGNGNVLKELVEPEGAVIFSNAFTLGDETVSTLELWGAEYQESNAILIRPENKEKLLNLAHRERCTVDFVGVVTGNKKVILSEDKAFNLDVDSYDDEPSNKPFDLDLELILGKMPQKTFNLEERKLICKPLELPSGITMMDGLSRVLRLVTVGSKRFLTNKVDRCVTGLIAQQQCVGPLHTPLADFALTALSTFGYEGIATAIGEQPIKGLGNPVAGGRMAVFEALTNLMFVKISTLKDIKCSGNWMWAAKLPGEGASLYRTCEAMCQLMKELGIAIDGGKDSLSMAARVNEEVVKAPGTLVVSVYAPCPDVRIKVSPDLKSSALGRSGRLLWVSLSGEHRLGGSALAQCFSQVGTDVPDAESPHLLAKGFNITQQLLAEQKILSGHDISDGGMITCLLEMAFAGLSGLQITLNTQRRGENKTIDIFFAEETGWIIEVDKLDAAEIIKLYTEAGLICQDIGETEGFGMESMISIRDTKGNIILNERLKNLFEIWEETSYKLETKQTAIACAEQEFLGLKDRKGPSYKLSFNPNEIILPKQVSSQAPRVAVIREEGTNGDREMAASLYKVGFETWDVTMQDLLDDKITVDFFRGLIFPGGFSYADVLGSAKGWAACLRFNVKLRDQFEAFKKRKDTFSLGVCNGCQLSCLLGWVGSDNIQETDQGVILLQNKSERFECRFSSVIIEDSPSVMCKDMGGSILGVWVAHGEGQFVFKNEKIYEGIEKSKCVALRYVDDNGVPTTSYPMNPNGSRAGIAGICSEDGRHLALMPHPERATVMWQWPYVPEHMKNVTISPWLKMFRNAYEWVQTC